MEQTTLKQELQKFNVTDAAIADMKEKFMPLAISGLDDKEGIRAVHDARMLVKGKRVEVEKVRKALNEDALAWQKTVNAEAKRITGLLEPIESHLEAEEDKIEKEKKRIEKEKERQEQERINGRIAELIAAGCMYDGRCYSFGHLTIDPIQIKLMDDQPFLDFMSTILDLKAQEEAKKAEEARLKEAEEARLKAEREELERAKKEQAEREEAFRKEQQAIQKARDEHEARMKAEQERIAKEALAIQKKKDDTRIEELSAAGLSNYDFKDQSFVFYDINVSMVEIKTLSNEEWAALLSKITPVIAQRKKEEEERSAAERRRAIESAAEKARLEAEDKIKREAEEKAAKEAAEKAEAERQEALRPDKEKLQAFASGITSLLIPSVTSEGAQQIVNDVQVMLGKIQAHILNKIKAL